MKVVILAGGLGTRLSEETALKPKPMVEIGERPILWHIMKSYSHYGFSDFVVCLGYKGYVIKEYFSNYFLHMSDVTFDMRDNSMVVHQNAAEPWRVTLVDTGPETQTGGRIKRIGEYVHDDTFMLTYGDGVADVDIRALVAFHRAHGRLATITAVQPLGRFGAMQIDDGETVEQFTAPAVRAFREKPEGDGGWVNGGFFVLEPAVLDRIAGDETLFERRLEGWPRMASCGRSGTVGSGSRWTRCVTCACSRACGTRARRRGRSGIARCFVVSGGAPTFKATPAAPGPWLALEWAAVPTAIGQLRCRQHQRRVRGGRCTAADVLRGWAARPRAFAKNDGDSSKYDWAPVSQVLRQVSSAFCRPGRLRCGDTWWTAV